MTEALRFSVYGRVQGVSFRAHTRQVAIARQLSGWAINRSDGSVDILLVGQASDIAAARADIVAGPSLARVDRVEQREPPVESPHSGFTIR